VYRTAIGLQKSGQLARKQEDGGAVGHTLSLAGHSEQSWGETPFREKCESGFLCTSVPCCTEKRRHT
jgi:hypothetical protein